ncbi:MAG: hypothetical protein ACW964_17740 [Candidatus Hodarchaeales archaeon]|jgi:hypothetical protein
MTIQKRDAKGQFTSTNPKRIVIRVTEKERQIIERYRQIKSFGTRHNNQNLHHGIEKLINKRVQNLEL